LWLFGSDSQKRTFLEPAARGDLLICLGNTEPTAGSDVANIAILTKHAKARREIFDDLYGPVQVVDWGSE